MARPTKKPAPSKVSAVGEGDFLITDELLSSLDGDVLISQPETHSEAWKNWFVQLPTSKADQHLIRTSPRTEQVQGDLNRAKQGLVFADVSRYGNVVHLRQVLLTGSAHQVLDDRAHTKWALLSGADETAAAGIVQHCMTPLADLIAPRTLGWHLEVLRILQGAKINRWTLVNDWRDQLSVFVATKIESVADTWLGAPPTSEAIREVILRIDQHLERLRVNPQERHDEIDDLLRKLGTPYSRSLRQVPLESI